MTEHPTDRMLAAFVDDHVDDADAVEIGAHVDACASCRFRIAQASSATNAPDLADFPLLRIELADESQPAELMRGQIWRLSWDDESTLAVIWSVTQDRIRVLPVVETPIADEWSLLVAPDDSTLDDDFAVNVALAANVPLAALDANVATLTDTKNVEELVQAFKTHRDADVPTGDRVLHNTDERLVELEETGDLLARFANVPWPPQATEHVAAPDFEALLTILGEDHVSRALAIANRGAVPTDDEAIRIEAATGHRPTGDPVPEDVVRGLSQPRYKSAIQRRAAQDHLSEAAARAVIAREVGPHAVAARGTYGQAVNIATLLDRLLLDDNS